MTQVGYDLCVTTCAVGTGKLTSTVTYNEVPPLHVAGPTLCVMGSHFPGVESDMVINFSSSHWTLWKRYSFPKFEFC